MKIVLIILIFVTVGFGQTGIIITETNLRAAPNQKAKVLKSLKIGDAINSLSQNKTWFYVEVGKIKGWIHGNSFKFNELVTSPGAGWYLLAKTKTGDSYFYKASSVRRVSNNVEYWIKVIPNNLKEYVKATKLPKTFAYSILYTTAYCEDKRISQEQFTAYDKNDNVIFIRGSQFISSYREPVVPDSVGEIMWSKFCK